LKVPDSPDSASMRAFTARRNASSAPYLATENFTSFVRHGCSGRRAIQKLRSIGPRSVSITSEWNDTPARPERLLRRRIEQYALRVSGGNLASRPSRYFFAARSAFCRVPNTPSEKCPTWILPWRWIVTRQAWVRERSWSTRVIPYIGRRALAAVVVLAFGMCSRGSRSCASMPPAL
jgi:hypothetical protein